VTYGGTPKPLGPEFEVLERAGRPEQDAERAHIRLESEAMEAQHEAVATASAGRADAGRPSLIERLLRIVRRRER
jgi:hypothetical protein